MIFAVFFGGLALYAIWKRSWIAAWFGLVLISTALGLAAMWASSMGKSAEQVAAGRPYCLALPSRHRPVQSYLDMTLLVARGDRYAPHMMLWVEQGEGVESYNWSYRRQRFQPDLPFGVLRNCRPRKDFLANLAPAAPGMHFSVGQVDYLIPAEFSPKHMNLTYITLKFGQGSALRATRASIEWDEQSIYRWRNSDGLSKSFAPDGAATVRSEGEGGFDIRTFDDQGELVQIFGCISGQSCRLQFFSGPFLFDVVLPLTDAQDAADVRTRTEALWRSFRKATKVQGSVVNDPRTKAVFLLSPA